MLKMFNAGIIVGSCRLTEWLLSWWWLNYSSHNSYPVTFVDFGMTDQAKAWCREKGALLSLKAPEDFVVSQQSIDPFLAEKWESIYTKGFWSCRKGWFKKPLAMVQSPYEKTLWLDLDCEICGSLSPLFTYLENNPSLISVAREPEKVQKFEREKELILPEEITFNSGVVSFSKESYVLQEWAQKSLSENQCYIGDQHILSRILYTQQCPFKELPLIYNWNMRRGPNPEAVVLHWVGAWGKTQIQEKISALKHLPFLTSRL